MKMKWRGLSVLMVAHLVLVGCPGAQTPDDEVPTEQVGEAPAPEEHEHHHEAVEDVGVIGMVAQAEMRDGEGEPVGTVTFTQTEEGVVVEGEIEGLEPGVRGFHVHEYGECEPPDFMSAGGHFNPEGHPHGGPEDAPEERHAGDFGNIEVGEDGRASFSFVDSVITLGEGTNDVVGQSLMIHVQRDDLVSQPVGDAGPRAACGIIEEVQ